MTSEIDEWEFPGLMTHRGSTIAIDNDGLYVQHGAKALRAAIKPLQWSLISAALAKLLDPSYVGKIVLEINEHTNLSLRPVKKTLSYIELTLETTAGTVNIGLNKRETDLLHQAARSRSHKPTHKEQ